jgi:uncharacterized cupredoxin-like copper-binding protein
LAFFLFLLVAVPALAQACGAKKSVVHVTLGDYTVEVSPPTVPAGTPVKFEITNKGKEVHEFVIEKTDQANTPLTAEVGGKAIKSEIEEITPGKTVTLEWTFTEPGVYQVACHREGHFESGMKTTLTVAARRS